MCAASNFWYRFENILCCDKPRETANFLLLLAIPLRIAFCCLLAVNAHKLWQLKPFSCQFSLFRIKKNTLQQNSIPDSEQMARSSARWLVRTIPSAKPLSQLAIRVLVRKGDDYLYRRMPPTLTFAGVFALLTKIAKLAESPLIPWIVPEVFEDLNIGRPEKIKNNGHAYGIFSHDTFKNCL